MDELVVTGQILTFDQGPVIFRSLHIRNGQVVELSQSVQSTGHIRREFPAGFIVPAFVDSHVHILELGLLSVFPDLSGVERLEDVFDIIADARELARELKFLVAFNLEPGDLREQRMPLACELDRVLPDTPAMVSRADGHSSSLNTKALDLVRDHCLPLDGLELDHSRLPTGVCSGMTHEAIARVFKRMLPGEIKLAAFRFAAQKAVRRGVLSVGAMCGTDDQPSMAQPEVLDDTPELLVKHAPELPVDVVVYAQTRNIERVLRLGLPRIGGCILTDGSFGSRTAALHEAYYDAPSERGILYIQDEDLEDFFGSAHNKGLQVAVHAIGDRAVDQVVRCWNKVLDCRNRNSLRHRIEHAELLNTGLIQSIAELGLVLCVQPVFEQRWGGPSRMYATRLGSRYRLTNPWHELVKTGVVLAGGSDAPITPIDPIAGINAATSHPVVEHSVTRLQACRMFSDWAAYSLGIEHRKGSLTPGHDADFVHLSANPLETTDFRILGVFRSGTEVWAASSA